MKSVSACSFEEVLFGESGPLDSRLADLEDVREEEPNDCETIATCDDAQSSL